MDCIVGPLHPESVRNQFSASEALPLSKNAPWKVELDAMKSRSAMLAFANAALMCALVWVASPWFTGRREPWDADSSFYFSGLVIAGAVTGVLTPKPAWALYLGAIAGQLSYQVLFLKVGPLFPLGALFLMGYCLVFLAAAALVGYICVRLQTL